MNEPRTMFDAEGSPTAADAMAIIERQQARTSSQLRPNGAVFYALWGVIWLAIGVLYLRMGVLTPALFVFLTGVLYLVAGAVWSSRVEFVLGVWTVVVGGGVGVCRAAGQPAGDGVGWRRWAAGGRGRAQGAGPQPGHPVTATAALMVAGVPFLFGGLAIGYSLPVKAALPVTQLVFFPIAFGGGLLFPPALFPGWLQIISTALPSRGARDLVVWAAVGTPLSTTALLALAAWTILTGTLATWAYRRDQGHRFH